MAEEVKTPTPTLLVPVMTREQFALQSGLGEEVVRGMLEKGHLPSIKIGRHRLVNLIQLSFEAFSAEWEK